MKLSLLAIAALASVLYAGPNAAAKILVDLDISTPQIDSVKTAATGTLTAGIVCKGVVNLDSYSFDIAFDTAVLSFSAAVEDNPLAGMKNILKKNGGQTVNVNLGLKTGCVDTININNTLTGSDSAKSPEGDGLLGIVLFTVKKAAPCVISVHKAIFLDYEGLKDTSMTITNGVLTAPVACRSASLSPAACAAAGPVAFSTLAQNNSRGISALPVFDLQGRVVARCLNSGLQSNGMPAKLLIVRR